jgi:peptide chain release factor 1
LDGESGRHQIQRVPPTEKRGRTHTSSITVSVLDPSGIAINSKYDLIDDKYFKIEWFSGTGKGGQHRNKKQNSCKLTHIPTGICEVRQGRSREINFSDAKQSILRTLVEVKQNQLNDKIRNIKCEQTGIGSRSEQKVRTYRFQDNIAIDHITNKNAKLSKIMKGKFHLLWK